MTDYALTTLAALFHHPSKNIRRHAIGAYKALQKYRQDNCPHLLQEEISDGYRITYCPKCNKTLKTASL